MRAREVEVMLGSGGERGRGEEGVVEKKVNLKMAHDWLVLVQNPGSSAPGPGNVRGKEKQRASHCECPGSYVPAC